MRELADHILDLMRNSLEAGADEIELEVVEDQFNDLLLISVRDNGRGFPAEVVARATDAFYTTRTTRRFGLGLALLEATCEQAGGCVEVLSEPGCGATVRAQMRLSHLDRPPLGEIGSAIQAMGCHAADIRLQYRHTARAGCYVLDTAALDWEPHCPLTTPSGLCRLAREVREGLRQIGSNA
ncbi:MAG: ATP-binding protein [Armatimonadia bacterium]